MSNKDIHSQGEAIAQQLGNGVRYEGPQLDEGKLVYHYFTDVALTGTTFVCNDFESCKKKLIEKRKLFGAKPPEFSPANIPKINWNLGSTDLSYYDGLMKNPDYYRKNKGITGDIKYYTPDGYMRESAIFHKSTLQREYEMVDEDLVSKYAGMMEAGDSFPIPILDYSKKDQEGRHRVAAAARLGETHLPVLVVKETEQPQTVRYNNTALPQTEEDDLEIENVIDSGFVVEMKTGAWKKQLNMLGFRSWEVEMYWFPWSHEDVRPEHWSKRFRTEDEAKEIYDKITSRAAADKYLTREWQAEVLNQYPIGGVPDNTEKETKVPESPMPILKGSTAPPKVYPRVMSMKDFREKWEPKGWKIIFIGPTSTWRQDWGEWEAIRDLVQNALDETETYKSWYDEEGLWIADQGKGVAVADFLLGPPKLKPDYARGKYGEGMKIASLALLRKGYPVHVLTVGKELYMIFVEQEAGDTKVQSLAALWRPDGTEIGTKWHIIGYFGDSYSDRFTINLPKSAFVSQAPTRITQPKLRYDQLIKHDFGEQSRIFGRDIYMKEINSPFSYNLWGFEMAPDRTAPKNESDIYVDMGRVWSYVNDVALLESFFRMVKDPAEIIAVENHNIDMTWSMGRDNTGELYSAKIKENAEIWKKAWNNVLGSSTVIRTNDALDPAVRHLGYSSVTLDWGVKEAVGSVIKTDRALINESQDRLREVEVIPDSELSQSQRAHLELARAIGKVYKVGGVVAAIIPPASDRVRTAGMYGRTTQEVYISLEQLETGRKTIDTVIHELAHHTSGAEDLMEGHSEEMTKIAGKVVSLVSEGSFDSLIKANGFGWY